MAKLYSFNVHANILPNQNSRKQIAPLLPSSDKTTPQSNTHQATHLHPALDDAADDMKEAVQDLQATSEEIAGDSGIVSGLVDSMNKALVDAEDVSIVK